MTRFLLAGIIVLGGLLLLGRIQRGEQPEPQLVAQAPVASNRSAVVTAAGVQSPAPPPVQTGAATNVAPEITTGTPNIDLLARLESHRRLTRAASSTYFDSLFTETDSVLRRWPDSDMPLLVAVLPDSGRQSPGLVSLVRAALAVWEESTPGIRFMLSPDTASAHLVVSASPRADGVRVGQTHLEWARTGAIRSSQVTLAKSDSGGRTLPPAVAMAVAVHEIGHALGLPHSSDPADVMFPVSRVGRPSQRDRATLLLLYQLPLGSVRATK